MQGTTWEKAKQPTVQSRHDSPGKALVKTTKIITASIDQELLVYKPHRPYPNLRFQAAGFPNPSGLLPPSTPCLSLTAVWTSVSLLFSTSPLLATQTLCLHFPPADILSTSCLLNSTYRGTFLFLAGDQKLKPVFAQLSSVLTLLKLCWFKSHLGHNGSITNPLTPH